MEDIDEFVVADVKTVASPRDERASYHDVRKDERVVGCMLMMVARI